MTIAKESTLVLAKSLLDSIHGDLGGTLKTQQQGLTVTGTISALNGTVGEAVDAVAYRGVSISASGTFSATISFETSNDGVNWQGNVLQYSNSFGAATSNNGSGNWLASGALWGRYFRARATGFASGTVNVTIVYLPASPVGTVGNQSLNASTATIGNIRVGGIQASGNIAALNASVDGTTDLQNYASARLQIAGTFVGQLVFQSSVDGTNWVARQLTYATNGTQGSVATGATLAHGDLGGRYFRVVATAWTSGTATVSLLYSAAPTAVAPMPPTSVGITNATTRNGGSQVLGTDGYLVVAPSPGTPLPAGTNDLGNVGAKALVVTGPLSALNASVGGSTDAANYASVRVGLTGDASANMVMQFQTSVDGTNWTVVPLASPGVNASFTTATAISGAQAYVWTGDFRGRYFRVVATSYTAGTVTATLVFSTAQANMPATTPWPSNVTIGQVGLNTGTNRIGNVGAHYTLATGTITSAASASVDGTTDLGAFSSVHVQVVGPYSGTLAFQWSNDGANWSSGYLQGITASSGGMTNQITGSNPTTQYSGPVRGRYFRLFNAAYNSGTAVATILYSTAVFSAPNGNVALSGQNVGANNASTSGALAALNATVDGVLDLAAYASIRVQITGTWSGVLSWQASVDGTNWVSQYLTGATGALGNSAAGNGIFTGEPKGRYFRVQASTFASGTATVTISYSAATAMQHSPSLSTSVAEIGKVSISSGSGRSPVKFRVLTTASTNGTQLVTGGRWLQTIVITNPTANSVFVKLYDLAAAPNTATPDIPDHTIPVGPYSYVPIDFGPNGIPFGTGIYLTATANMPPGDTTATNANVAIVGAYV